ncbi:hypothetical protein ACFW04_008631 [Cataglyphis niger]
MQPLRHINDSSNEPSTSSSTSATVPSKKERVAFVFYDFETRQDETLEDTTTVKKHIPTLCVAQQICEACAKENNLSVQCRWCGFVDFATRSTKCFKQIICIAHNAKAFDAQFILKYIVENCNNLEPKLILNGTKIVVLTVGHTKFIDSVNYMPMRLSDLSKAFGLQNTADKGIFPHLFNTVENQLFVGPLPDLHYYSPESMKTKKRKRFLAWHADMRQKNTVFDFQCEIIRYCRTDVDILRQACMAFRKIFIDRGNVCPFEECTTIVSTCMTVFRKNFLYSNTIGVIPAGGYRKTNNHSRRAREYRTIDGTLVDGYYETSDTTGTTQRHVLQFHGCFWHECPSCFPLNRDRWECSFDRDMRDNREMREYLDNDPLVEIPPLDPRDAFFGTEKIHYVDVCALYPYVLKTGAFPIGHPNIYVGDKCSTLIGKAPNYNFNTLEGLIRCRVLTPRNLFHPVLPYRAKGKLLFALCRSCCETFSQTTFTHNNADEHEFQGTWVSCEIRKAIEKGYLATAVSEIWQYKVSQFDYTTRIVLDKRNIVRNAGLRSVAKLCLNFFGGKFGQRSNLTNTEVVRTQQRFMTLLTSAEHEITDILPVNDEVIYVS